MKRWYLRKPWNYICILILILIAPATYGTSLMVLFGLYRDTWNKPL